MKICKIRPLFLLFFLLLIFPLTAKTQEIEVIGADTVLTLNLTSPPSDCLDSKDAPPQNLIKDAFVSHADSILTVEFEETPPLLIPQKWSFAIITDLHIGRGYKEEYQGEDYYLTERLKNVVKWINENRNKIRCENEICPIKFLAILGDITDNTPLSGFCKTKEILDKLEIPYIVVFGNHDVGTDEEYKQCSRWKGQDYFDQVFWSTSSIPCQNSTSTKNFETLLKEFNFQRDEKNRDYKNFSFNFGGLNFIGLDFVSREKFMKVGRGVDSDAVLKEVNKNWMNERVEEFKETPTILFTHHPFKKSSTLGFSENELKELRSIINNRIVLFDFGGHFHSFDDWFGGKSSGVANANKKYEPINNTQVLTTEALMIGSNGRGVENTSLESGVKDGKKGIIRIVKVFDKENINPYNWETTETGDEFVALNPRIAEVDYETMCSSDKACMEFESSFFTEKEFLACWKIDEKVIGCGDKIVYKDEKLECKGSVKELKCKFSEFPKIYNLNLIAATGALIENISKKIEVKAGILSKTIKAGENVLMYAIDSGRDMIKKGSSFMRKVLSLVQHSNPIPVALFTIHFEQAKENIDLTNLIIDSNLEKQKSILYMEQWPNEVEKSKVLFIPKK